MRNVFKILVAFLLPLVISCSSDDTVSPVLFNPFVGDVVLESQAEVDAFTSNNYSEINGSLRISAPNLNGPSNITDLSGLSTIQSINGDLEIFSNAMTSLNGFENVTAIAGSMFISFNPNLTEINALSNLTTIGGDLSISSQENLTNINGLSGLTEIPGFLTIGVDAGAGALDIPNLTNLDGLSGITSVGEDLQIAGTGVTTLAGLEGITAIDGTVKISFNANLSSVNGLQNLTSITGDFVITQNSVLQNLSALSSLQQVGGNFEISSNTVLSNTNGLENITTVGEFLNIYFNSNLTDLGAAFANLESVQGIAIDDGVIEELSQFTSLTTVDFISISNNSNLASISGFNVLPEISSLNIFENIVLSDISGFNQLVEANALEIIQPETIVDEAITITGFNVLSTIGNRIRVIGLANQNLDFLSSLNQVVNITIAYNENLSDYCDLNSLIFGGGLSGNFSVFQNLYNPTLQDMLDGNCSL